MEIFFQPIQKYGNNVTLHWGGHVTLRQENVAGWVAVALRSSQLHDLVDMLRNEKPVYFTWTGDPGGVARITTQEEPIGEEERRRGLLGFLFG
jgi:hypothetical protein